MHRVGGIQLNRRDWCRREKYKKEGLEEKENKKKGGRGVPRPFLPV